MTFMVERPSEERLRSFLRSRSDETFTYDEVGVSRRETAGGFVVDSNRVKLGEGEEVFGRAVAALRGWRMLDLGWASVFPREAPIEVGAEVAVVAEVFGLWSVNPCRVVYVAREERRFGFAYGTLAGHAARGEERFVVELADDGSVHYDIRAFSRPGLVMRLGYPVARRFQRRFAKDSLRAMSRAVSC